VFGRRFLLLTLASGYARTIQYERVEDHALYSSPNGAFSYPPLKRELSVDKLQQENDDYE
jgi:hypothetical protein